MTEDAFITVEDAAALLRCTQRHVHRYADHNDGPLRTRRAGKRTLFYRADVEALAAEINAGDKPPMQPPQIVPPGEMLDYLRDRDRHLSEVQNQLTQALILITMQQQQIAQLQAQLEQRLLPEEAASLHAHIAAAEATIREQQAHLAEYLPPAEVEELRQRLAEAEAELAARNRPWWRRMFGG